MSFINGFSSQEQPDEPRRPGSFQDIWAAMNRDAPPIPNWKDVSARFRRIFLVAVLPILVIVGIIAALYFFTDWLWFSSQSQSRVLLTLWGTRIGLFLLFGLISGAVVYATFALTERSVKTPEGSYRTVNPGPVIEGLRTMYASFHRPLAIGIAALVGVTTGLRGSGLWETILPFLRGHHFGVTDPLFGKDYSFYAFRLPFYNTVVASLLSLAITVALISIALHYIYGTINIVRDSSSPRGRIELQPATRRTIAIMGAIITILVGISYWLDRFDMLSADINFKNQTITGAGFTSVNVVMAARLLLTVIAVVCAVAFIASFFLRDLRIPALAIVLMVGSNLVLAGAWPFVIEQFSVKPNKAAKEHAYIERNIQATRYAFNLTDKTLRVERNFGKETAPVPQAGQKGVAATLANVRLLDPNVLAPAFTQNKQLRSFYGFPSQLAIDRYEVDGRVQDYIVAVREIDPTALTGNQTDWINRHTVYTHGNGFIAAPANTVDAIVTDAGDRGGNPKYEVYDIQSLAAGQQRAPQNAGAEAQSSDARQEAQANREGANLRVDQPRIYYGPVISRVPNGTDYAVVGTAGDAQEYDTDGSAYTYTGRGGVRVGSWLRRLAFTVKYRELNFILSRLIGQDTKVLMNRDPRQRVEMVAPWLTVDHSAYPVVVDGRIKWIIDGYTTLSSLPYAQKISLSEVTQRNINRPGRDTVAYMRNSVKAVVDAYDGSVNLYAFDPQDPVLATWMSSFPGVVQPLEKMSPEVRKHVRYPEDIFRVQREILSRYHVTAPQDFYTGGSFWQVPHEPTAEERAVPASRQKSQRPDQPPYYVVSADPQTGQPSFQLTSPMLWNKREFLSAQISVSSDPANYGIMTVRQWPTNTTTQGPKNALDRMTSAGGYQTEKLQLEGANEIIYGNLLTLPLGDGGVLYVEPLYAQRKGQDSAYPKLIRVMVMYNNRMGYGRSLASALQQVGLDGSLAVQPEGDSAEDGVPAITPSTNGPMTRDQAAARLSEALAAVRQAQASGNLAEFGRALEQLDKAAQDYQNAQS